MKLSQEEVIKLWPENMPPLLSICCITYNHKNYIVEALDSFLMQKTDFPFEVLIHDDASTDGTTEIVQMYSEQYPRIIKPMIQTENQFNTGGLINLRFNFPRAKGKYIALCDGDDYWVDCNKLQKQVEFLELNPDFVITYSDSQPFDKKGFLDINFGGAKYDISAEELIRGTPIFTLTTCFRNVLGDLPFELRTGKLGDQITWSLLGEFGKGKYLSDILPSAYRVHDGGIHSSITKKHQIEMTLITSNALMIYYYNKSDLVRMKYFRNYSFKLSRHLIGWRGIIVLFIQSGAARLTKFFKQS